MSEPFLSEIRIFSFPFAPKGWLPCDGRLLPINQNQALFSLLGTMYGGNGQNNFGIPNLQGRVPFHIGQGLVQGEMAGQTAHTLIISELPTHTHFATASSAAANNANPVGNFWADGGKTIYNNTANTALAPQAISNIGGSQAHDNMSPYLVLNFCIAVQGVFPSRN